MTDRESNSRRALFFFFFFIPRAPIILETMLRSESAARTCRNASSGMAKYVTRKPELYFIVFGDPFHNVPASLFLFPFPVSLFFLHTYKRRIGCFTDESRDIRIRPRDMSKQFTDVIQIRFHVFVDINRFRDSERVLMARCWQRVFLTLCTSIFLLSESRKLFPRTKERKKLPAREKEGRRLSLINWELNISSIKCILSRQGCCAFVHDRQRDDWRA